MKTAFGFVDHHARLVDSIDFATLRRRVDGLSAALANDHAPGARVLLVFPPGLSFIEAFLGCLRAGLIAVPAPFPRGAPETRRLRILASRSGATAVMGPANLAESFEPEAWRALSTNAPLVPWDRRMEANTNAGSPPPLPAPEATAFLQFTSGSTATPKGAIITHANVMANQRMIGEAFAHDGATVFAGWLPHCHDMGLIGNILHPLYLGIPSYLMAPHSFLRHPEGWLKAISAFGATTSGGPNFGYRHCLSRVRVDQMGGVDLSSWKVAFNGAEPVEAETLAAFAERFAGAGFHKDAFFPCYGLAEATLFVAGSAPDQPPRVGRFAARDLALGKARAATAKDRAVGLVSCGRAAPGLDLVIVDPERRTPRAPGEVGEIWLRGASLAAGYWGETKRDDLSAWARMANGESDHRYLRTGDLGFIDTDGELFISGRRKDIIIVRGRNYYPRDMERIATAACPPGVTAVAFQAASGDAVTVLLEQRTAKARRTPLTEAHMRAVRRSIREEMDIVVDRVVTAAPGAVRRTTSGKIARAACRAALAAGRMTIVADLHLAATSKKPRAVGPDFEERIIGMLADISGQGEHRPATTDALADLGFDSLSAGEFSARLLADLGIDCAVERIMAQQTVGDLVALALAAPVNFPVERIAKSDLPLDPPLSPSQMPFWFLSHMDGGAAIATIRVGFRFEGRPDRRHLAAALAALVARHPILAAKFIGTGQEAKLRYGAWAVSDIIAEHGRGPIGRRALGRFAAGLAARDLDIRRRPPFQADLIHGEHSGCIVVLRWHHIIADLWSISLLLDELGGIYDALAAGEAVISTPAADLPPTGPAITDGRRAAAKARALARLGDWPARLDFSAKPKAGAADPRIRRQKLTFPRSLSAALRALAKRQGATLHAVLLAAYQVFLAKHTGQRRFLVAAPTHGRRDAAEMTAIGCFIDTLLLRADLSDGPDFAALVARCAEETRLALKDRDCPHAALTPALRDPADPGAGPVAKVLFALQRPHRMPAAAALVLGDARRTFALGSLRARPLTLAPKASLYDIGLVVVDGGNRIDGALDFRTAVFDRATADRMAARFIRLLTRLTAAETAPVTTLDWLATGDKSIVGADTDPAPHQTDLWALFAEQAAATPEAEAILCGAQSISYATLAALAERGAAGLRTLGIGAGDRVAVSLPPSIDAVAAMLALWRLGAVYVPLDPAYPPARQRHILEDSGAGFRIADEGSGPEVRSWPELSDGTAPSMAGKPPGIPPSSPAYIIYTSGSSGAPKGVVGSHAGAIDFATAQWRLIGLDPTATVLQVTPLAFDASLSDILMAVLHGARLCIASGEERLPGQAAIDLMRRQKVTLMTAAPSFLEALPPAHFPHLRRVISMAEPCRSGTVARWSQGRRFYNGYGPTEATIGATLGVLTDGARAAVIGAPLAHCRIYILDRDLMPLPHGARGEIFIGGAGVSLGYWRQPARTAAGFLPDPLTTTPGARMYRTGDFGRLRLDGELEFLGRADAQVKIRGYRVEPREIDTAIRDCPGVEDALTLAERTGGEVFLLSLVRAERDGTHHPRPTVQDIRDHLRARLPSFFMPREIVILDDFPLTPNGKIDHRALRRLARAGPPPSPSGSITAARPSLTALLDAFRRLTGRAGLTADDNFFDAGLSSLDLPRLLEHCRRLPGRRGAIRIVDFFHHPTTRQLDGLLFGNEPVATAPAPRATEAAGPIAVIGIGLRLPDADTPEAFWANLRDGRESVRRFDRAALIAAGVPATLADDPNFVPARAIIEDMEFFDARYFGLSPRDAALMDPQLRLLLECAQWCFDDAGYAPRRLKQKDNTDVGVFVGAGPAGYYQRHIAPRHDLLASLGPIKSRLGADKSFFATTIGYQFDLTGPCLNIDTACSTALVAIHQACQSLRAGECGMAVAGAMSLEVPAPGGHLYDPAGIGSPDGHCRAFDAAAAGTLRGLGGGCVLLKPLAAARADRDHVYAVILGSAVNNDGRRKVGFTAPAVAGQAAVARRALARAGVMPETISHIECHGTGTALGDAVEIEALAQVFAGREAGGITLGSVKTNIGHLDAAAGFAGFVKTVLALAHGAWPPSLHYTAPTPDIGLDGGPFQVATALTEWTGPRRRAGVSSFGIGGTNAHLILQNAPPRVIADQPARYELICLSAPSPGALATTQRRLAEALEARPSLGLGNVAFTLAAGRQAMEWRAAFVSRDKHELVAALRAEGAPAVRAPAAGAPEEPPPVVFLLPGQGAPLAGVAADLHAHEPAFRRSLDRSAEILTPHIGPAIETVLLKGRSDMGNIETDIAQPLIAAYQFAVADWLASWGLRPTHIVGHSLGELVGAGLAGVLDREAALIAAARRGAVMQATPPGVMIAISAEPERIARLLPEGCHLAAINGPENCTAAGRDEPLSALIKILGTKKIAYLPLAVKRAFHGPDMDPAARGFAEHLRGLSLGKSHLALASGVTGDWHGPETASDPDYWAAQMRQPVRFAEMLAKAAVPRGAVGLDLGPGRSLFGLAKRAPASTGGAVVALSPTGGGSVAAALAGIGKLWTLGALSLDRPASAARWSIQCRQPLPGMVFERARHWIDPPGDRGSDLSAQAVAPATRQGQASTDTPPPVDKLLADIWSDLLGAPPQSGEGFIEAGGDSLTAGRFAALFESRTGQRVDAKILYEARSIDDLARRLGDGPAPPLLAPGERQSGTGCVSTSEPRRRPLSRQQHSLWLLAQSGGPVESYQLPVGIHFDGPLEPARLEGAFAAVLVRHPILSCRLDADGAEPVLVPMATRPAIGPAVEAGEGKDPVAAFIHQTLSLAEGPLIRARLIRANASRHSLLLLAHHLVCDGVSLAVMLRDLARAYRAPGPLDPVPDHAQYVRRQAALHDSRSRDKALSYWRDRLADARPTRLAGDHPRSPALDFAAATVRREMPPAHGAALQAAARGMGVTPFCTVCAAVMVALRAWTGHRDITLGVPMSVRPGSDFDDTVGFFVDTIVLRETVHPEKGFDRLALALQQQIGVAQGFGEIVFEDIVEALDPPRVAAETPFFTIAVADRLQVPGRIELMPGLSARPFAIARTHTQFDLTLWLDLDAPAPRMAFEYRRGLFDAGTIESFAATVAAVLRQMAVAPGTAAGDFMLSAGAGPSAGDDPAAPFEPVHQSMARWAEQDGEAVAIEFGPERRSHGWLASRADALALALLEDGLAPGGAVGICLPRCLDLAPTVVAVMKAGGVFVMLEPDLPPARLRAMMSDAATTHVLADATTARHFGEGDIKVIRVDRVPESPAREPPPVAPRADSPAYIMFTSGSTGAPKGAVNTAGALANRLAWMADHYHFTAADKVLQKTPLGFDVALWELLAPLIVGATVVLAEPGTRASPRRIAKALAEHAVTVVHFVPSMFDVLVEAAPALAPSLRLIICSGEALSPQLVARFEDRYGDHPARLANLYGPTEAAIDVSFWDCPRGARPDVIPIGRPIRATALYILDDRANPLPDGAVGEIFIGGGAPALGYAGRPGLTAAAFAPDPFIGRAGSRMYRTGDLARRRADGEIEFMGRRDDQIKISGRRVEPGEIKAALMATGLVAAATVTATGGPGSERRIKAHVVPDGTRAAAVRRWAELAARGTVDYADSHLLADGTPIFALNRREADFLYREIAVERAYFRHAIALAPQATVVDVGANIGLFSLIAAREANGIRLISYEPVPQIHEKLRRNLALYCPDARVFNLGLGANRGMVRLTYYPHNSLQSGRQGEDGAAGRALMAHVTGGADSGHAGDTDLRRLGDFALTAETVEARMTTLSEEIEVQALDRIDLLKIDVEGAELEVLAGIEDRHWPRIGQVVVEVADTGGRLQAVSVVLRDQGFAVEVEPNRADAGLAMIYARRPGSGATPPQAPGNPCWRDPLAFKAALRATLADKLPAYMVPAEILILDALPLTPSGKLDRGALPEVDPFTPRPVPAAALDPTQSVVAEVWRQVLGRAEVSPSDDFFEHGGSSLAAARLAARLESRIGRPVDLLWIMNDRTIAGIAARLGPLEALGAAPEDGEDGEDGEPGAPLAELPVTPVQQAYLTGRSAALALGGAATQGYLELDVPDLDVRRFGTALNAVIARHAAMRTVFPDAQHQEVLENCPRFDPPVEDWTQCPDAERKTGLAHRRQAMAGHGFDPAAWPLFDVRLSILPGAVTRVHFAIDAVVADGTGIVRLQGDLNRAYRDGPDALTREEGAPDFADYLAYLSGAAARRARTVARAAWSARLDDLAAPPALPYRRALAAIATPRFSRRAFRFNAEKRDTLRRTCVARGVTPTAFFLAVYAVVLAEWSAGKRFSINLPISNRPVEGPEFAGVVGNFTALMIVEIDTGGGADFLEHARRTQQALARSLAHRAHDGVHVLRELARRRHSFGAAVMPVVFTSLLDGPTAPESDDGPFRFDRAAFAMAHTSQATLDCICLGGADHLSVMWDAVEEALDPVTLDAMFARFEALARRFGGTGADWETGTNAPTPGAAITGTTDRRRLDQMFRDSIARDPDRMAVITPRRSFSYGRLGQLAAALAARLGAAGVGPGDRVAIHMHKGWEQAVAVLGVLTAGAAYVPIRTSLPRRIRRRLFETAKVVMILCQPGTVPEGGLATATPVLAVDDGLADDPAAASAPSSGATPDDLAYVIFTSGTTGTPKGVMIDHRGAANTLTDINARFAVTAKDAVFGLSSLSFDLSVYDLFGTFAAGATLVIPDPGCEGDPGQWLSLIESRGVTIWNSVPALAELLADHIEALDATPVLGLRLALLSGDWIPLDLGARLGKIAPDLRCIGLGGATEASIWSIFHEIELIDPAWRSVPYGRPLAGQDVGVLDEALRPRPVGVAGEIHIAGLGLATGYLGDPDQTARKFVTPGPGGTRWYKTGDLGRLMTSGEIEFLGRADSQIKIHGNRIELGEIEAAMEEHPAIHRAVVAPEKAGKSIVKLRAFLQISAAATGAEADISEWRRGDGGRALAAALGAIPTSPTAEAGPVLDDMIRRKTNIHDRSVRLALAQLKAFPDAPATIGLDQILAATGIQPRYRRWLARALDHLVGEGALTRDGDRYGLKTSFAADDNDSLAEPWLAAVLTGRQHAAERYAREQTEQAYQEHFSACHKTAAAAFAAVAEAGGGAPLSVLEAGAGYGSLSRHLLPALPAGSRYLFTDISRFFLEKAKQEFGHVSGVATALLDVDGDAASQGFEPGGYDIVVAASVLHAVKDVGAASAELLALLKPGGLLLMIEETKFFKFFDLGMGLQTGFDACLDTDLRPAHALLSRAAWRRLLKDRGFEAVHILTDPRSPSGRMGFDVIVAAAPDRVRHLNYAALRDFARARLPRHAVPATFRETRAFPLSANGKIDRRALIGEVAPVAATAANPVLENETQRLVAAAWRTVLGVSGPAPDDDFFALGGDSLAASKLVIALRKRCHADIPLRAIFEAPTLAEMAALMDIAMMMSSAEMSAAVSGVGGVGGVGGEL